MNEEILSYLWRFQQFNHQKLETSDEKSLSVYNPGYLNINSGPDFSEAKISIDKIEWHGHIEIHVNSSDWIKHGHSKDSAYQNVILHVVWNHDREIHLGDYKLPVLELKGKVRASVVEKALSLLKNFGDIPCAGIYNQWDSPQSHSAFEGSAVARLERKCNEIKNEIEEVKGNWEEAFFRKFTANLGFRINKEPFYALAKSVTHKLVVKNALSHMKTEALLMGVAGHLSLGMNDLHFTRLNKEYHFLKNKFGLNELVNPGWKFLRMRPANFPTSRIAQLASIYSQNPHLFRKIMECRSAKEVRAILKTKANPYWENHYLFGHISAKRNTELGDSAIDLVVINTVAPFLFCYGKMHDLSEYMDLALNLLQSLKAEDNRITRKWKQLGRKFNSALETQGSIELFEGSCQHRKCMHCKIGIHYLVELQNNESPNR